MSPLGPFIDWYRVKKRFFTALVWVLLACIPATWAYLYKDELHGLIEKKAEKGKK